jgi:class 3 adenylate cyclase
MGTFKPKYTEVATGRKYGVGTMLNSLPLRSFKDFNTDLLGLGQIYTEAQYTSALAAIFDLEGFTQFCHQADSDLEVPEYLNDFLTWLFVNISDRFKEGRKGNRVTVWGSLPFFVKFLGDGVLFLWDTERSGESTGIGNIILILNQIRKQYVSDFLPYVKTKVDYPPQRLRCGIARGKVMSVGESLDYVGSCINAAARLQKLSQLAFAFKRSGLDPEECFGKRYSKLFVVKRVNVRGIGDDKLVVVEKADLDTLSSKERSKFKDPLN